MNRRDFFVRSTGAFATMPLVRLLGQAPATPASQPPAAPQGTFTDIRRDVGTFTAQGGTIGWLINKDAVIIVDTQYPNTAPICVEGVKKRTSRTIDLVLNTHHHADHTGGNGVFRASAKKIVAHAKVPELQRQAAAQTTTPNSAPPVVADATFETTWGEDAGGEHVTARHHGPGHTGGDAIVHFEKAGVVHMGDLLFHQMHPRVDRAAGASIQNWMTILETVPKAMPADTIYIAGHARPGASTTTDRAALAELRDYFDAALTLVRKGIAAGQTREAIAAQTVLSGFEQFQGSGTALTLGGVLGVAYDELTAKG
jgi:glyoxylase-like metal-dependent hydrolase (beta-lactamase superfamily II)